MALYGAAVDFTDQTEDENRNEKRPHRHHANPAPTFRRMLCLLPANEDTLLDVHKCLRDLHFSQLNIE